MSEHSAPVDVAHDEHRDVDGFGKAHVGDVAVTQIHLRRAAGAFDDDAVEFIAEPSPGVQHGVHRHALVVVVSLGIQIGNGLAVDDHLGTLVGVGFQQHRIEIDARCQPGRLRLQRLRPANLAAIDRDRRIQGHVLRLERRHAHTAPVQDAA